MEWCNMMSMMMMMMMIIDDDDDDDGDGDAYDDDLYRSSEGNCVRFQQRGPIYGKRYSKNIGVHITTLNGIYPTSNQTLTN